MMLKNQEGPLKGLTVLDATRVFRLTRSVAVNVVVMDYVEAAKLRGEGFGWVMRREILPNIMPPLIAEFGLRFCSRSQKNENSCINHELFENDLSIKILRLR